MTTAVKLSIIVLLVGASCARVPQEDQNSLSGKSGKSDPNAGSTGKRDESDGTPAGLSVSNAAPTDTGAGSWQRSFGGSWGSEMDINSGDTRGVLPTADGSLRYGIYESELSKEVRRLGISIPNQREWVPIRDAYGGRMEFHSAYSSLPGTVGMLLKLFDEINAKDEERRVVLERLMTILRTDRPRDVIEKTRVLIVEVTDRHGLASPFDAQFTGGQGQPSK